jgi:cyanuric acid amidohydrolase
MQADVHRFALPDPGDASGLARAIAGGVIDPNDIVAVIGKTHGNGLVNDYTRGYLSLALKHVIAAGLGSSVEEVAERIPLIFSGGVEGVLSPHYAVLTVDQASGAADGEGGALAIGVASTPALHPADIGRERQIALTAAAVREAMERAWITRQEDVHFVQIKGPAFTVADIVAASTSGDGCASDNPGKLMAFGRAASAFGAARALNEASADDLTESAVLKNFDVFSSVASASAGVEVNKSEVVVLGMSPAWRGPLAIAHASMRDALDIGSVTALLEHMGFAPRPQIGAREAKRIRAAFVKCEAQRDGMIRGRPHTMLNDGDIDQQRHIRGAVGAIVASVLNDTAIFVSGGAEHQGPDGGGLVAVIAEKTSAEG